MLIFSFPNLYAHEWRDGVPRGSCSSHHPGHCGHLHDLSPRPANLCGHKGRQVCRRGTRHPSVGSARGDGGIRSLQGPTGFPWFLPSSLEVATSSGHFVPTLGVKVGGEEEEMKRGGWGEEERGREEGREKRGRPEGERRGE